MANKKRQGLVQVNTGNGKGKTTAALGTILRAVGYGLKVYVIFFMKGHYDYGEYRSLAQLPNVTVAGYGLRKLTRPEAEEEEERREAEAALAKAREVITSGEYDIVLLDEINVAVDYGLIKLDDVIDLIKSRPSHVEVILTGRYADNRLLELADQITEMVKVKHPYDSGIHARQGIDC